MSRSEYNNVLLLDLLFTVYNDGVCPSLGNGLDKWGNLKKVKHHIFYRK